MLRMLIGEKEKGYWTCANPRCEQPQKPIADFSRITSKPKIDAKNRRCNVCLERLEEELRTQTRQDMGQVIKKARLDKAE